MKSFLEEYGFAILAAIVVILLIMMTSPVGTAVKDSLSSIVTKFTNTGDESVTTGNIGMYYAMSLSGASVGDTIVFDDLPDSRFLILNEKDGYTHVLLISGEQDKAIYSDGAVEDFGGYNALTMLVLHWILLWKLITITYLIKLRTESNRSTLLSLPITQ